MERGIVFNIQKFCVNDGPGIRTTVFLKGCPLRCAWCHNPESHRHTPEVFYSARKCISCGACAPLCKQNAHKFDGSAHSIDRENCISCGECIGSCPTRALELMGEEKSVDEVIAEVLRDKIFYDNSGGGITLSGGEPLSQIDFAYAILSAAREQGIHTAIESCGYTTRENIERIATVTDLFLYDWKISNGDLHEKYTGVGNERIRENLHLIDSLGKEIILRCPIIPDVNDTDEHFCGIAELASSLENILAIEIEPYHPLGSDKNNSLGRGECARLFRAPERDEIDTWIAKISALTAVKVRRS